MIKTFLYHILKTFSFRPCLPSYWKNEVRKNCDTIDDILSKPPYNQWDFSKEEDLTFVEKKKMPC